MNKTPCENVGYEAGDEFVLLSDAGPLSKGTIVKAANAGRIDGGLDVFKCCGSAVWLDPLKMQKLDADGWIEWKGGDMPVERGTLVDVKYRDGMETVGVSAGIDRFSNDYKRKDGYPRSANDWKHFQCVADIIAYRLHQKEKPELEQAAPTLDDLMHAWQKAKSNADTSRHILKLAEQDESSARKALDDALRAAGWRDAHQDEPLNITDWRALKPGDIVWWGGDKVCKEGEFEVVKVEIPTHTGNSVIQVRNELCNGAWINILREQWHFIRRPTFAAPPKKR